MNNFSIEIPSDEIAKLVDSIVDTIREDHFDELSDRIYESVLDEVKDNVKDWIDIDDLDIENSITNTIEDLLGQFNPGKHCGIGRAAEDVIKDGFVYAIENDDDFAKKLGSFIDKWIWKPSDEKHPEDSIKAILGREDASNIHDLTAPASPSVENKMLISQQELKDIIYLTISTVVGQSCIRDVNMTSLVNSSIESQADHIRTFLNTKQQEDT